MDFEEFYEAVKQHSFEVYFQDMDIESTISLQIESLSEVVGKYGAGEMRYSYITGTTLSKWQNVAAGVKVTFSMSEKAFKKCVGQFFARMMFGKEEMRMLFHLPCFIKITKTSKRLAEFQITHILMGDNNVIPLSKYMESRIQ